MIYFVAAESHYAEHLKPVFDELVARGHRGIRVFNETHLIPDDDVPVVSASAPETRFVPGATTRGRPVALLEHGVGQSYVGVEHHGYTGGPNREHIGLFLCPNEAVALANSYSYPKAQTAVVGCPKLDRWLPAKPYEPDYEPPIVAVSWHWDCNMTHESMSAWRYYEQHLPVLAERYKVLGHAHPRMMERVEPIYRALGIEVVHDFAEVLDRAEVYCVDNSSTGFEWLAVKGGGLVWVNSPLYRREVEHGLRFWTWADAAVQCDHRAHWVSAIEEARVDASEKVARRRRECLESVYAYRDGKSATRAADAIEMWADEQT